MTRWLQWIGTGVGIGLITSITLVALIEQLSGPLT